MLKTFGVPAAYCGQCWSEIDWHAKYVECVSDLLQIICMVHRGIKDGMQSSKPTLQHPHEANQSHINLISGNRRTVFLRLACRSLSRTLLVSAMRNGKNPSIKLALRN